MKSNEHTHREQHNPDAHFDAHVNVSSMRGQLLRGSRWGLLLLALVVLVQPVLVSAQANLISPWKTFRREDGLSSNNVLTILPVGGDVWFGTDTGISRFNGEWTNFFPTEYGFQGSVLSLTESTEDGRVWAGTDRGDVLVWNGQTWTKVLDLPGAVHAVIVVDSQVWIGSDSGLYIWDESAVVEVEFLQGRRIQALASQGTSIWVGAKDGLWIHQRNQWVEVNVGNVLPDLDVTAIWVDPAGPVWVAAGGDLAWRDQTSGIWTSIPTEILQLTNPVPITSLTGTPDGVVWGGTSGNGPFRVLDRAVLFAISGEGEIGLTTPFVQAVAIDEDGLVWFGTQSGAFRFDESMWIKELADNVVYPGINRISALESSVPSELWIGTSSAGIRFKTIGDPDAEEELFTTANSNLPSNAISALARDETGAIWAGTQIGVARYARSGNVWEQPVPLDHLPSELVTTLLADGDNLWIGTDRGLVLYSLSSGDTVAIDSLRDQHINVMTVDSLRRLWVGTLTEGLFVRDVDGTWQQHAHRAGVTDGLLAGSVVALAADPNTSGGVWAGIDQEGISYWDSREWHDLTGEAGLPSKRLYRFYTDPIDGSLWIGSEGGVSRYDGRTWGSLVVDAVLPRAAILAIGRSGNHYWFGGRDGLVQYRPEKTAPWIRFERVGAVAIDESVEQIQIEGGKEIFIDYIAGDLYTPRSSLAVLYRLSKPGELGAWMVAEDESLVLTDVETGQFNLELQARDQAFNYSSVVRLSVDVLAPPALVDLPFLPAMRRDYFIALVVTGLLAVVGGAYSIVELARSRRRAYEAISRGFNPFVSGEPVRREDMFFGRYDLLQRIVDTLHNNSIMIHGERRIGKTTLLYQLAARLREIDDQHYWFVPLYIDLEGTAEESFFHFLMEEMLTGVLALPDANEEIRPNVSTLLYYRTPDTEYSDREFSRDLRNLIDTLQNYAAKRYPLKQLRIILMLDEMDVMSNYSRIVQQQLRRIFMRDFAATLGAVVAGIQISKDWDRIESPWYNLFNEIELQPFTREQSIELLTQPIADSYEYEPAALEYILEHSAGKPYRLQQFGLEAVNLMLADKRRQITLDDVQQAKEQIERLSEDNNRGIPVNGQANGLASQGIDEDVTPLDASSDSAAPETASNGEEARQEAMAEATVDPPASR